MKLLSPFLLVLLLSLSVAAQERKPVVMLTGASFASPENGWFEISSKSLDFIPLNRAVGGTAINDTANNMAEGKLYSQRELEDIDVLVIMHTHDRDVFDPAGLKEEYGDYTIPFDRSDYAAAYDYVIKKYTADCYALKDDPGSKYYGTDAGKYPVILICTHWHDSRRVFNGSVRRLADKWGLPLVEFDKMIGFTSETPHPVTKGQVSLLYAQDKQTQADGITYGWHPKRGEDEFVQKKLAAIFSETLGMSLGLY